MNQHSGNDEKDALEPASAEPEKDTSSIRLADLIDLYTRPRRFFSGHLNICAKKALVPVIWMLGIAAQLDRFDTEIMRHEIDVTRATWGFIEPLVSEPWAMLWVYCLAGGIISGALHYWIAGWWYGLRVRWSGAGEDFDKRLARAVYSWSSMISAVPHILITIGFTFSFPNYLAAYHSGEMISLILPIAMFWSVGVSYTGATENFSLTPWKARLWFLVFPALFYLFALGLIVFLLTFFS